MEIELIEVVVLGGEAVSADDHIVFYDKVHGITGLVSASPEEFVIFQIIGKHKAAIRLCVTICHTDAIKDIIQEAGIIAVDIPFIRWILQHIQTISGNIFINIQRIPGPDILIFDSFPTIGRDNCLLSYHSFAKSIPFSSSDTIFNVNGETASPFG